MSEIGTAYVQIMPSTRGMIKQIDSDMNAAGGAIGPSSGRRLGAGLAAGVKGGIKGIALGTAIGGLIAKGVSAATGAITSHISSAISRVDTLANYPRVMSSIGVGAQESCDSIKLMSDRLSNLPTRLDAMAASTQSVYTAGKSMGMSLMDATKASLGLNDMLLAGGQGTAIAEAAMTQFTQALSKGKPDMQDWKSVVMAAPAQMDQLAKSMLGPTANSTSLYEALKSGKVTMADVMTQIAKLDTEGGNGFASFASQAESATGGIKTSMDNMENAITKGIANVIKHVGETNITGVISGIKSQINAAFSGVVDFIDEFKGNIDVEGFKKAFQGLAGAFSEGFNEGGGGHNAIEFGGHIARSLNRLIPVLKKCEPYARLLGKALDKLSDAALWCSDNIDKVVLAFAGFRIAEGFVGGIRGFLGGLKGAGDDAAGAAPNFGQTALKLLSIGAAATLAGAGLALAAIGFRNMADAAVELGSAGTGAQVWMGVMVGAFAGLVAAMVAAAPRLQANASGMLALGIALTLAGEGLVLVSNGFQNLVDAVTQLSSAGTGAQVWFGVMVGLLAAFVAVLVVCGPALTANAVGMVALGGAVALVGVGVLLATAGIALLATQLPAIAAYGPMAAAGLLALGGSLVAFGAGAIAAGAGALVAGAGLMVLGAGAMAAGVGVALLGVGLAVAGAAMALCAATSMMLGASLPMVAASAMVAASGLLMISAASVAFGASVMVAGAGALVCGAGLMVMGAGAMAAAVGVLMLGAGTMALGTGLTLCAASVIIVSTGLMLMGPAATMAAAGMVALAPALAALALAAAAAAAPLLAAAPGILAFGAAASSAGSGVKSMQSGAQGLASSVRAAGNASNSAKAAVSALGSGASGATGGISSLALGLMAVPGPAAAAAAALRSVRSSANGMPRNVSINIRAYDHASAAIGRVAVALAQLNGRTSTVHINTVETTTKHAAGGIIRRHASGAVFTQPTYIGPNDVIGEAGAEYYDGQHIVPLQGRYGRGFAKEIADSMPAGGTTYVLNVDGATVNGDEHVRGLFLDLLTELKRRADM